MQLEVFKNAGFEIRGGIINNEPYFVLADICRALGLTNPTEVAKSLNDSNLSTIEVAINNRQVAVNAVNESGLYKTIFQSRKKEALVFQEWVTSEVLPTIRKHGAYLTPEKVEEALLNPDTIIQLATQLKAERAEKDKALHVIESQKPMVAFAKRIGSCAGTLSIQDFAKVMSDKHHFITGEKRLFKTLRENGFLMKDNKPYQRYIDMGIFEVKEASYKNTTTDELVVYLKTRVTAKGQEYLISKLDEIIKKSA